MDKRISSRGVIISCEYVYLMYRRKNVDGELKEYYVIPGGGLEENESFEDNLKREIEEEFSVDINVLGFLGTTETDTSKAYFFSCEIINDGIPKLGGPELEKNNESNYYEIRKVSLKDIDNLNVIDKDMIIKAFNKEYKDL